MNNTSIFTMLYAYAVRLPRWMYLSVAIFLYGLMLSMGAVETTVDALPGRETFSKVYHVIFYGGLAGLLWFGLRNASVSTITVIIAFAGVIDELHQHMLPFRYGRVSDVLIDTVAALIAALILQRLRAQAGNVPGSSPVSSR